MTYFNAMLFSYVMRAVSLKIKIFRTFCLVSHEQTFRKVTNDAELTRHGVCFGYKQHVTTDAQRAGER